MSDQNHGRLARLSVIGFIVCAALLAGCSGDDGDAGPQGAAGLAGPPGAPGTPGAGSGVPIDSVDPESERIEAQVTGVTVPAAGGAPVVSFTLKNDLEQGLRGLQASEVRFVVAQLIPGTAGGSSQWRSYITRLDGAQTQGNAEVGTAGTLVDNGDGTYRYTFAQALTAYGGATYDATLRHRVGFEIRGLAPTNNAPFDFAPGGGALALSREIVDNDTCNACHDVLEFHGGARFDTQYCVVCHSPQTHDGQAPNASLDLKVMIHKIHAAQTLANTYQITGFGGTVFDFSTIVYPQDVRNCGTCHEETDADTPEASNWRMVANRDACGTCHDDIDFAAGGHPGGLTFSDDTQCLDCHGPTATVNGGAVQTANAHRIPLDVESEKFAYQVVSVTDAAAGTLEGGEIPRVTVRVVDPTNVNTAYDIQAAGGPFRQASAALRVDLAWAASEISNMLNPANGNTATSKPFQPMQVTFANGAAAVAGVTNNGDGTFSANAPFALPSRANLFPAGANPALEDGGLLAIAEGRPRVTADGVLTSAQVAGAGITVGYDGVATARRRVVEITRCNQCHEVLSLHGGNRTDNTELCATCHNPNATDIAQRTTGNCVNAETSNPSPEQAFMRGNSPDVSIALRFMIHAIHSGPIANYVACGNGGSVIGFGHVHYPGKLNNCEGCHVPPTATNPSYYGPDPTTVLATSIDSGADRTVLGAGDQLGVSPTASACAGCHVGSTAVSHMKQNGGVFGGLKEATGAVQNAAETCALCHGPGRTADIRLMHGIPQFQFNSSN